MPSVTYERPGGGWPEPMDIVTMVEFGGGIRCRMEPYEQYMDRHIFAEPKYLIKRAFKLIWLRYKRKIKWPKYTLIRDIIDLEKELKK